MFKIILSTARKIYIIYIYISLLHILIDYWKEYEVYRN